MNFRKIKGSRLFTGNEFAPENTILITDTHGVIKDLIPGTEENNADIEYHDGIICPGFINAHCHLELSALENIIPTHTGMVPFLIDVMKKRHLHAALQEEAMKQADLLMRRNGIVAVGDISNTSASADCKLHSSIHYHTFVEVAGFVPEDASGRAALAAEVLEAFHSKGLEAGLSPHAPYSVSGALLEILNAETENALVTIHSQESEAEDIFFKEGKGPLLELFKEFRIPLGTFNGIGKSSPGWWLPHFNRHQRLLLVHNLTLSENDIEMMRLLAPGTGIGLDSMYFCLCPNANKYIQDLLPHPHWMEEKGLNIVLGTDSLASNHTLNIWEEIRTLQQAYPSLSMEKLLRWGTLNGAKMLSKEDVLGSFEKGKRPGVVCIKEEKVEVIL